MSWILPGKEEIKAIKVTRGRVIRRDLDSFSQKRRPIDQRYYEKKGRAYQKKWRQEGGWAKWYAKNREKKIQYLRAYRRGLVTNTLGGGFGNGVVTKNFTKSETAQAVKLIRGGKSVSQISMKKKSAKTGKNQVFIGNRHLLLPTSLVLLYSE